MASKYEPKILVIDIETKPTTAYVWKTFKENIGVEQIIEAGGLICFAAKWVGKKDVIFYSNWTHSQGEMVKAARDLFDEADAVVTYNGDDFDIPILTGEFALEGLTPPAPITSIDVLKTVRKFRLPMNKLAFVAPHLRVGEKYKHEGFELWAKVMKGDAKAQKEMRKYNEQDTIVLESLYLKVRPFIKNHPHLSFEKHECGACGSTHVQKRGFRYTRCFKIQRVQCQGCGSWFETTRTKFKKEI